MIGHQSDIGFFGSNYYFLLIHANDKNENTHAWKRYQRTVVLRGCGMQTIKVTDKK